jgi:hypothetical protein
MNGKAALYVIEKEGGSLSMLTLKEKLYLLKLLKAEKRKSFWGFRKKDPLHDQLAQKLEQMVRNEKVNKEHL